MDAKLERLNKIMNEKPYGEVARLRLGLEEAEKEMLRLKKQAEGLKAEAKKVLGLMASYAQKQTYLATLNARFDDRVAVLDVRLDKMAKAKDEEFAPMLRDAKATREFLIRKGFRYFLNKLKKSDILGSCFGACMSAAIADGMRQGLEAGYVHGKKGTNINSIPDYNPNATEVYAVALKALSDVSFPLLKQVEAYADQPFSYLEALLVMGVHEDIQDEARTFTNPASGSTSPAGGVINKFYCPTEHPLCRGCWCGRSRRHPSVQSREC
ncbi:hypothetical protein Tco_0839970 [Tanacetum coccineum]|uniref:Uncharacterized protein n=1 Tax=Tanacetum coccineum TaxID=301880 RepID=A0ABQ5AW87_9ASTR